MKILTRKKLYYLGHSFRKSGNQHIERSTLEKQSQKNTDLSINFTYNSNAIEGSTITIEETEDIIKNKISPNKLIDQVKET